MPQTDEHAQASVQPIGKEHSPPQQEEALDLKKRRVGSLQAMAQVQEPLLPIAGLGETIVQYFTRLKSIVQQSDWTSVDKMEQPGLYLYKRPIRTPGSAPNTMLAAGSVFHHCVLFLRGEDGKVCSIDYGPADGCDVTANIMQATKARGCVDPETPLLPGTEDMVSPNGPLPLLYLGKPVIGLEDEVIKQALALAESRDYHALRNNCIHFADALTRLMTGGAVRSAPLIYDIVCGDVPAVDNPMIMMMQMLLQASWFSVCDGSALFAEMVGSDAAPSLATAPPSMAALAALQQGGMDASEVQVAAAATLNLVNALSRLVQLPNYPKDDDQQQGSSTGSNQGSGQVAAKAGSAAAASGAGAAAGTSANAEAVAAAVAAAAAAQEQQHNSASVEGAEQAAEEASHAEAVTVPA